MVLVQQSHVLAKYISLELSVNYRTVAFEISKGLCVCIWLYVCVFFRGGGGGGGGGDVQRPFVFRNWLLDFEVT